MWDGLDAFKRSIEAFPKAVEEKLQAVAKATAERELETAKRLLRSQQKTEAHALADAIHLEEDSAKRQYRVVSTPPDGQPPNVTIWNEFGTSKMEARPYMRPASHQEIDRYRTDMEQAAAEALAEAFD